MVHKSLAFIYRNNYSELLCFEHPITFLLEVVRGTVENGESPSEAIVRELYEEAGLQKESFLSVQLIVSQVMDVELFQNQKTRREQQYYHGYLIQLTNDNFSSFNHRVVSDGVDDGHFYTFQWYKITKDVESKLNPNTLRFMRLFHQFFDKSPFKLP